ncbi:MAG TPA: hypothetical protein VL202_17905 [Pararhizobium sp.]|uniref:hypothetical protein n=1 Tax=Pararhizobium sp. TaxID=1977563 RepID=UPI002B7011A0|nr:hypothetical protein [Pararhizobium sp.]HTO33034.1 hypothetical protein [Pararhizobium sp.]
MSFSILLFIRPVCRGWLDHRMPSRSMGAQKTSNVARNGEGFVKFRHIERNFDPLIKKSSIAQAKSGRIALEVARNAGMRYFALLCRFMHD